MVLGGRVAVRFGILHHFGVATFALLVGEQSCVIGFSAWYPYLIKAKKALTNKYSLHVLPMISKVKYSTGCWHEPSQEEGCQATLVGNVYIKLAADLVLLHIHVAPTLRDSRLSDSLPNYNHTASLVPLTGVKGTKVYCTIGQGVIRKG